MDGAKICQDGTLVWFGHDQHIGWFDIEMNEFLLV
jgi:hypothetical protein